jgi:hypothetical protein
MYTYDCTIFGTVQQSKEELEGGRLIFIFTHILRDAVSLYTNIKVVWCLHAHEFHEDCMLMAFIMISADSMLMTSPSEECLQRMHVALIRAGLLVGADVTCCWRLVCSDMKYLAWK